MLAGEAVRFAVGAGATVTVTESLPVTVEQEPVQRLSIKLQKPGPEGSCSIQVSPAGLQEFPL